MSFMHMHVNRWLNPAQRRKARELKKELERMFVEHPHETGETYLQHLWFTVKMGARIVGCGLLLLIHGLLPFTFRKTVSFQIEKIYGILKARIPKQRLQELEENWDI